MLDKESLWLLYVDQRLLVGMVCKRKSICSERPRPWNASLHFILYLKLHSPVANMEWIRERNVHSMRAVWCGFVHCVRSKAVRNLSKLVFILAPQCFFLLDILYYSQRDLSLLFAHYKLVCRKKKEKKYILIKLIVFTLYWNFTIIKSDKVYIFKGLRLSHKLRF